MPIPLYDVNAAVNLKSNLKSDDDLNVNGKKFHRNSQKTIWSYNPDDTLIRVCKLFNIFISFQY
jgi:hypothetical protein